jgi:hypothetical protein
MKNGIKKGSIVKYNEGFYRVSALFSKAQTVNLQSIFGSTIYFRGVPLYKMEEAHDEWYDHWSKSETYMSM